jgi:hypothetical protein
MVHTNPEFENFEFDFKLEFDQQLGSHKHVINIIMGFRDMGCYRTPRCFWADAISTACYVSNRIFLRLILLLTPFEL